MQNAGRRARLGKPIKLAPFQKKFIKAIYDNKRGTHTAYLSIARKNGKTALIARLTGVDTYRLREEKARGISIDLGFAPLCLPDGTVAGVVDVPGHERFIHNMLAGIGGIDLVLMVVDVNEGALGAIIGQFKSGVTKQIRASSGPIGKSHVPIWQRNYFDHIIRNDNEHNRIHLYIEANPSLWEEDEENPVLIRNK